MYVYEKKYFFALENCKKLNQEKRFKINVCTANVLHN